MALFLQSGAEWPVWLTALSFVVALLGVLSLFSLALRRIARGSREDARSERVARNENPQNPSAFMTASMQAVIQKLKEQEKELERLHREEKERAEQTVKLSEEVTRNMPAGLLLVNAAGLITSVNPAAETTLGCRGLSYRRYSEALGGDSDLTRLLGQCLAEGKIFRREQVKYITPEGGLRRLGVTISPIQAEGDKVNGALCLLSDLTEVVRLQKQVQLKENLAALGELSAGIAHEFKNGLATISGYAQMLRSESAGSEAAEYAERILEQTRAITHVVTEFLKYARPLEVGNEQVAVRQLVERAAAEVQEAYPQVSVLVEGEFADISGDEGLLRQAILNLARNAAEACRGAVGGGRVRIRGTLNAKTAEGTQQISVIDNGPGIPTGELPKIFRPFYTTKADGTGLGLAIVQKIIVQHGGSVEVRNRSQGGAEFMVTLPVRRLVAEPVELAYGGI
jgi:PAS domain S-box-containing protein